MQSCLGVSIGEKIIKYAKIEIATDNAVNVKTYGIKFHENLDLEQTINQIIQETASERDLISIDINNEKYYYFNITNLSKEYTIKAIETEFELFCGTNHINKNSYDGRYLLTRSLENQDQNKVIYIYDGIEDLEFRYRLFDNYKLISATPLSITISNLVQAKPKENYLVVNLDDITVVTTIINQAIYNIDSLNVGMKEVLESITTKENSYIKAYEKMKNTTINNKSTEVTINERNEYLQDITPTLFKISQEVKAIALKYSKIDKIYLTGIGTSVNNIEVFFQEYFPNAKIELLKPYFLNQKENINIKDFIEVNSAIALAMQGLNFGAKTINFKKVDRWGNLKELLTRDLGTKVTVHKSKNKIKKHSMNWNDKNLKDLEMKSIRIGVVFAFILIIFSISTIYLNMKIEEKKKEITEITKEIQTQIQLVQDDDGKVITKTKDYERYKKNLENISSNIENKRSRKNQLTTLLNKIVYNIPKEVKITEIKNIEKDNKQHIIIYAQSFKYEQLGYFKAKLQNANILENITSTYGETSDPDTTKKVVIEGDLNTY